ncbi:DUF1127 domain-containing protein [Dongia sp.]|jgi:uncharacterized protein YjiS (DUF1127 family)|uniref:DUF1127 domain-containing protein n=1 Tax=Dongia sp. TaxID=1977262 RepID=UPI0035B3B595
MTQISLFSGSAASSQRSAPRATHLISTRPLATLGRLGALVAAFQEWQERYRTRRDLMRLSDYQLKDIGLNRLDAEEEFAKPFWRG